MDWSTTVFMFPGQGSQIVGMGKDIAEAYPAAREVFKLADEALEFSLSTLCFEGPQEELDDTINTQPALYTCGIALLRALRNEFPDAAAACVAGHSLGEFTALAAAGALTFEDGLRLVRERGRLMKLAGEQTPGAMAALLGMDTDPVRELCARASQETGGTLVLANDNCPGQIVISGDTATIERGLALAKNAGAKRAVKLAVSIASHSPLMASAADAFGKVLDATPIQPPRVPLYANTSAAPITDVDAIRHELHVQLTQPVRWTESVHAMIAAGMEHFIEIGSKDVLCGLLKRIDGAKAATPLNSFSALQQFVQNHK